MKKNSKRYKEILKKSKDFKSVDLKEILELIKKNSTTKFDESIDVSLRIGLKQSKGGDFNLRTVTQLPAGTGKKLKIAVLCEPDKTEEAKKSGADIVGSDDLIEKISNGKFNFDKLICTPGMMGKIGKHGKVLGPKGLMPNPKLGSVSDNIKSRLDLYFGDVEINFQFMRISQEGVFAPHEAHNDTSMSDYSMMIYLNRLEDCQGGTSFVSHIEEGMKFGPVDDEQFIIWKNDHKDQSKWFIDDIAEMKPNRAVIFESDRMHRSEPIGGFGKTTKDARLVLVTFFNANP